MHEVMDSGGSGKEEPSDSVAMAKPIIEKRLEREQRLRSKRS